MEREMMGWERGRRLNLCLTATQWKFGSIWDRQEESDGTSHSSPYIQKHPGPSALLHSTSSALIIPVIHSQKLSYAIFCYCNFHTILCKSVLKCRISGLVEGKSPLKLRQPCSRAKDSLVLHKLNEASVWNVYKNLEGLFKKRTTLNLIYDMNMKIL